MWFAFFRESVESILLYGSETWTMKKILQNRLDGTYTRLLMRVQNISWREHKTKADYLQYHGIPPISTILAQGRPRFSGHCYRAKDQIISEVICLRLPCISRGRRPLNFIGCVARDINQQTYDFPNVMADKDSWRRISIYDQSLWSYKQLKRDLLSKVRKGVNSYVCPKLYITVYKHVSE